MSKYSIKELVFAPNNEAVLNRIDDGDAIYDLNQSLADGTYTLIQFRVPKEDLRGAVFNLRDTPKVFMRWIRKELERQKAEEEMIAKAREDWKKEQANG